MPLKLLTLTLTKTKMLKTTICKEPVYKTSQVEPQCSKISNPIPLATMSSLPGLVNKKMMEAPISSRLIRFSIWLSKSSNNPHLLEVKKIPAAKVT